MKTKQVVIIRDNIKQQNLILYILKKAEIIIPVSEYINGQIETLKLRKRVVHCGIDCFFWNPNNLAYGLKQDIDRGPNLNIIAQISQITQWKNHIDFIKAANIIVQTNNNTHFLIIGDCLSSTDYSYKKFLIDEVRHLGLEDKISFLGFQNDIRDYVSQIDILLHPAINEPFGRVIIEAMAMKKPIVSYNCGGAKEIIRNNVTGFLVNPYDYNGLADKCLVLLTNKLLRNQFGKAGRKLVKIEFNINKVILKMEEIFENINIS